MLRCSQTLSVQLQTELAFKLPRLPGHRVSERNRFGQQLQRRGIVVWQRDFALRINPVIQDGQAERLRQPSLDLEAA